MTTFFHKKRFFRTIFCINLLALCYSVASAQFTPEDQRILDSLIKHDDFFKMLNEIDNPRSVFRFNVGLGTMPYSAGNKGVQSMDTEKKFLITPSAGYFHKSGFGMSAKTYAADISNNFKVYQFALSPSYSYTKGETIDAAVSYVHYFKETKFNSSVSLLDDEFVVTASYKKGWIVPRITGSYSQGKYRQAVQIDTSFFERNRLIRLLFTDTAVTNISAMLVAGGIEHDFVAYNLLSKKDGFRFTPQLAAYFGVTNYTIEHSSTAQIYHKFIDKKLKKLSRYESSTDLKGKLGLQSVGLDLNFNYAIGKVYFEPDLYLDYYVMGDDSERFTQVYNFNIGITF